MIEPADVEFLRVSAEAGNNRAMLLLADCYNHGWGTEPDPEAAFTWFYKAAEAGDTSGMVGVANCYDSGVGTARDKALAYQWDLRAAEAGDPAGMLNTEYIRRQIHDDLRIDVDQQHTKRDRYQKERLEIMSDRQIQEY